MDEEETIGCNTPRKKLDDDLKSGAGKEIIDEDVVKLKECLDTEPEIKKDK